MVCASSTRICVAAGSISTTSGCTPRSASSKARSSSGASTDAAKQRAASSTPEPDGPTSRYACDGRSAARRNTATASSWPTTRSHPTAPRGAGGAHDVDRSAAAVLIGSWCQARVDDGEDALRRPRRVRPCRRRAPSPPMPRDRGTPRRRRRGRRSPSASRRSGRSPCAGHRACAVGDVEHDHEVRDHAGVAASLTARITSTPSPRTTPW